MFDILIVGATGQIGKGLADRIARQEWSAGNKIKNCYLTSRDYERAEIAARRANNISKSVNFIPEVIENLGGIDAKIAVICADANKTKEMSRDMLTIGNIPMIANLIPVLTKKHMAITIAANNSTTTPAIGAYYQKKFEPEFLSGIVHVDTLRARGTIRELYKQATGNIIPLEALESIFVIGGHNSGEMIPAFCSGKIGEVSLDTIELIKKRYGSIKFDVEKFGERQMKMLGDTNADSVESIILTLDAMINEKSVVCVSRYCDFRDMYFKKDPDYAKLVGDVLPLNPTFQVLPVRFKNLKTEFHDLNWFSGLDFATKSEFYAVAERHLMKINELMKDAENPKRTSIKKLEIEEVSTKNRQFDVVGMNKQDVLATAGNKIFIFEKEGGIGEISFKHPLKKTGRVDSGYYATFEKGFYLLDFKLNETRKLVYDTNSRGAGLNKVIKFGNDYFASDSAYGVLKGVGSALFQQYDGSARSLTEYSGNMIFINKNKVVDSRGKELFTNDSELVDLLLKDNLLVIPDVAGNIHITDFSRDERISLGAKVYCACLFNAGSREYVALGTEKGVTLVDLRSKETSRLGEGKKIKVMAGGNGNLVVAEPETYLKNLMSGFTYNLKQKIMSIHIE